MITIYLTALLIGGALVALASFLGHGDAELEGELGEEIGADLSADLDVDVDIDSPDTEAEHTGDSDGWAAWFPFLSLRFWAFVLAFGGLTGTLLSLFSLLPGLVVFGIATGVGYVSGAGITGVIRRLKKGDATSTVRAEDMVGRLVSVTIPVRRGRRGQVTLELGARIVHESADTQDSTPLESGDAAVVYDLSPDGVLLVTRAPEGVEVKPETLSQPLPVDSGFDTLTGRSA